MPIRINLLAETKALEDQRRRDPVKRVILLGIVLVVLVLFWWSSLLFASISARSELSKKQSELNSRTNDYRQILDNQSRLTETKEKLDALHTLATNRFLNGNLLEAMQKNTLEDVQLTRLKISQTYAVIEEAKPKTGSQRSASGQAKPSEKTLRAIEKNVLTLDAKDTGSVAGDAVNKFQEMLSSATYFQQVLGRTNNFLLVSVGTPQSGPDGKTYVLFTLEARFPEKMR
jgi:hypothetical protein